MDSLALLCNLYGDGPATLRRLRDAGCTRPSDVDACRIEDLATVLRTGLDSARRFQREAHELASRCDDARPEDGDSIVESELCATSPLRPSLIDGLDLEMCVALRSIAVISLEDLAAVEPLDVSLSLECGVTRVMRLQFLARRLLDTLAVESEAAQPERETLQPLVRRPSASSVQCFSPAEPAVTVPEPDLQRDLEAWSAKPVVAPIEGSAGPFG